MNELPRILIAGIGNELRQDDAFGIELARRLSHRTWPENVSIQEFGIGGIHLVQHLSYGFDILIMLDAVQWGKHAGEITLKELVVAKLESLSKQERAAFLADMHYANPQRALMLAQALGVLPKQVLVLGCKAADIDDFAMGMSTIVKQALPKAELVLDKWLQSVYSAKTNK